MTSFIYTLQRHISTAILLCFSMNAIAQYTLIPDEKFETKLIQLGIDTDSINGKVLTNNIASITNLQVSDAQITDLTGIEGFSSLVSLRCKNNKLTSLDLSKNNSLTTLQCYENQLVNLDLSNNKALTTLDCSSNLIESLNLFENTALRNLNCSNNKLSILNLNTNINLIELDCHKNSINNLYINSNTSLVNLDCSENLLGTLDLSKNTELLDIICAKNNLVSIDASSCNKATYINVSFNKLNSLDLRKNDSLQYLICTDNPNLPIICVKDANKAESNSNYKKDLAANWSETCLITFLDKTNSKSGFNFYPNPCSGMLNIQTEEAATLRIINATGQVVFERALNPDTNNFTLENLPKGSYVLSIITTNATTTSHLVLE